MGNATGGREISDAEHCLIRYYSKRPSPQDPRLALLPGDLFQDARVLDVGCNEGYVTCQIGAFRPSLIDHARGRQLMHRRRVSKREVRTVVGCS